MSNVKFIIGRLSVMHLLHLKVNITSYFCVAKKVGISYCYLHECLIFFFTLIFRAKQMVLSFYLPMANQNKIHFKGILPPLKWWLKNFSRHLNNNKEIPLTVHCSPFFIKSRRGYETWGLLRQIKTQFHSNWFRGDTDQ